jgi:hypothetical protein
MCLGTYQDFIFMRLDGAKNTISFIFSKTHPVYTSFGLKITWHISHPLYEWECV